MNKTIEAIVFDLGGVLVELSGVSTMLHWSALALNEQSLWQRWLTSPGVRAFETGLIDAEDFADQIIAEMQLTTNREEFLQAFRAWPKGLYPGVPELLGSLRQQFKLACLSNTSALHWTRLMGEMGLEKHLDHHFASHLIGKIKPDADCFQHILAELQLEPQQVLFYDDNLINIDGANKVGMQGVHVRGFEQVLDHLSEAGLYPNTNSTNSKQE
jgi:putative hydrolase of the HAD superfamily